VGSRPEGRTWRDEWVDMFMERKRLAREKAPRSRYEAGGDMSIEASSRNHAANIEFKVAQLGWAPEDAQAYSLVAGGVAAPLAAAVRERSDRYAASTHAVCGALAKAARRLEAPAPDVYLALTGEFGLATDDPAWAVLTRPGAVQAGEVIVTNGVSQGSIASSDSFPNKKGYHHSINQGGSIRYELRDSAVVCFRSRPADADGSCHSMVQVSKHRYVLPPLSTVTLEEVKEAGEWEANGKRVRQRLFVVGVSYRVPSTTT
jgi:hypothetical protein